MDENTKEIQYSKWLIVILFSSIFWLGPTPSGLTPDAWHLFGIFISAILGIVIKAASMGTISMIAITLVAGLQLRAPGDPKKAITLALSAFSNGTIWMITIAFFISRGFIKTGLGRRIAYWFIIKLGKNRSV